MSEFKTRLHSVPSGGFLTDRDKDKKPILDVRELGIDFGGLTAVDGFNLMIGRNEITGLIGPNGAGKTTVFNPRLHPDRWNAHGGQKDLSGQPDGRGPYLPEHPSVQGAERHRQHQGGSARVHEV